MADTQGFSFDLGIGVIPEVDQKKYPEIYLELAQLRRAIRLVASNLDGNVSKLETSMLRVKRTISDEITMLGGGPTGTYTITPPLASITNNVLLVNLGMTVETSPGLADVTARLKLTDVSTISLFRTGPTSRAITVGFMLIEFASG